MTLDVLVLQKTRGTKTNFHVRTVVHIFFLLVK